MLSPDPTQTGVPVLLRRDCEGAIAESSVLMCKVNDNALPGHAIVRLARVATTHPFGPFLPPTQVQGCLKNLSREKPYYR